MGTPYLDSKSRAGLEEPQRCSDLFTTAWKLQVHRIQDLQDACTKLILLHHRLQEKNYHLANIVSTVHVSHGYQNLTHYNVLMYLCWMWLWAAWSGGWRPCTQQGGWNKMSIVGLFNPGHSVTLWFKSWFHMRPFILQEFTEIMEPGMLTGSLTLLCSRSKVNLKHWLENTF